MNPGDLKHRLIFQLPTEGVDEDGYPILEPTVYTRAWGKLKTLKGHTKYVAAQSQLQHHREFTIRYQPILEDDQRLKELELTCKGQNHTIESIENDDGLKKTMTEIARAE